MKASASPPSATMSRARSSSRCSTSVASSPYRRRRGTLITVLGDGVSLALARRRRHGLVRGFELAVNRLSVVVVAADGILELAHSATERATDLRQALRSEKEQREKEQEDDLPGPDVRHAFKGSASG